MTSARATPRLLPSGRQDSLPGRYRPWVRVLSLLALGWAVVGWLNDVAFGWLTPRSG